MHNGSVTIIAMTIAGATSMESGTRATIEIATGRMIMIGTITVIMTMTMIVTTDITDVAYLARGINLGRKRWNERPRPE
jgi:hypothetical protein